MFEDKECEGCIGVENYCIMPTKLSLYACPCLTCLVKNICQEHCGQYTIYLGIAKSQNDQSFQIVKVSGSDNVYIHKYYLVEIDLINKQLEKIKGKIRSAK